MGGGKPKATASQLELDRQQRDEISKLTRNRNESLKSLKRNLGGRRNLLGSGSERVVEPFSKARQLLESLDGIEFAELSRPDECCGFGGTFAVAEEAVSCMMGQDRVHDHEQAGTQVLTAADMSCLMHMDGLIRRDGKRLRVMHIAEILAGRPV